MHAIHNIVGSLNFLWEVVYPLTTCLTGKVIFSIYVSEMITGELLHTFVHVLCKRINGRARTRGTLQNMVTTCLVIMYDIRNSVHPRGVYLS